MTTSVRTARPALGYALTIGAAGLFAVNGTVSILALEAGLPPARLTDTSGNSYNLATSPSKPVVLLFFGYSHCPDVCVTVLADVAKALNRMSSAATPVRASWSTSIRPTVADPGRPDSSVSPSAPPCTK